MKKTHSINIICFIMAFLLLSVNVRVFADTIVNVTSISFTKNTDNLTVGGTDTLALVFNPPTATNQNVVWSSSNPTVVNVFNGIVMGVSAGTAVVSAMSVDGSKSAVCLVTVSQGNTAISLNKTSDALTIWGSDTLIATVNQVAGTSQTVTWASSNSAIVQVNNTGLIIGEGAGSAVITATSTSGNNVASCYVKVTSPVVSINLNKLSDYIAVGGSDTLIVTVNPPTATVQTVTWVSSNPAIVQVNDGILIGESGGSALITATTTDGSKTAVCNVTVNGPVTVGTTVTSIALNKTSDNLTVGGTDTLTVAINPTTATNQAITWSSSDATVATVVNGVITGVKPGTASIIAVSADGNKIASCTVVVSTTAVTSPTSPTNTASNGNIVRLGGTDRYQTSVAISQAGWKGTSSCAVLATANDYPDALSAAPLAKYYNAPILLTDKNSVPQVVITELKRLGVNHIFIVGGTGVISQTAESQLKTIGTNINTERLAGIDRFETSIKIAQKLGVTSGEIMVANGSEWPDALSASAIAAKKGIPIILTSKDALAASTSAFIAQNSFSKTYILGGTDIISDSVANKFPSIERIAGSDQYERNINIIKRFESDINFSSICVATGKDFPDALSGSAFAAMSSAVIVLVDDSNLSATTTTYISGKLAQINSADIFGLQGAISDAAVNKLFNK